MVTVKEGDASDIAVTLSPAVPARVVVRSSASQPAICTIALRSMDSPDDVFESNASDQKGLFVIQGVFPGNYVVETRCSGGYVASVRSGDLDLLVEPKMTVLPGVAPPPIEISLKDGSGTISCRLVMTPMPELAGILVTPASGAGGTPRFASALLFRWLAPGDYFVYAFSHAEDVEYRNPAFLQSLTGGVSVHVEEKENKEVALTSFAQ